MVSSAGPRFVLMTKTKRSLQKVVARLGPLNQGAYVHRHLTGCDFHFVDVLLHLLRVFVIKLFVHQIVEDILQQNILDSVVPDEERTQLSLIEVDEPLDEPGVYKASFLSGFNRDQVRHCASPWLSHE